MTASSDKKAPERHTIAYVDRYGQELFVDIPWGLHSGTIPPPFIDFYTSVGPWRFAYYGDDAPLSSTLEPAVTEPVSDRAFDVTGPSVSFS